MGTRAYWMTSRYRYRLVTETPEGEAPDVTCWIHADTLADIKTDAEGVDADRVEIERALSGPRRKSSGVDYEPYGTLADGRISR